MSGGQGLPSGSRNTDSDAVHLSTSGEVNGIANKASVAATDLILIEDSADGYAKKKIIANLLLGGGAGIGGIITVAASGGDYKQSRLG